METIKVKKGLLLGKFYGDIKSAVKSYNAMSVEMRKHQSVVEFPEGAAMIVGNSQLEAIKA